MTNEDFSNAFDLAIGAYVHDAGFGQDHSLADISFDEYEKSVFLTKAQEEIVKALYQNSFESTESIRRQLDTLVSSKEYTTESSKGKDNFYHTSVEVEPNMWFIVGERAYTTVSDTECDNERGMDVYPVTHDEYQRIIKNPFRGPTKKRILRLDTGKLKVKLVSVLPVGKYCMDYIVKPSPIILTDLSNTDVAIGGKKEKTECKLSSSIHANILDMAVQMAVSTIVAQNNNRKNY